MVDWSENPLGDASFRPLLKWLAHAPRVMQVFLEDTEMDRTLRSVLYLRLAPQG